MQKPLVRSSSMPLFMACSNSVLNPDDLIRYEMENEASIVGTYVHALAEETVLTGSADLESIKDKMSQPDYDRAGKMYRNFLRAWKSASKHFTKPQVEVFLEAEMPFVKLSGHMDVLDIAKNRAYVMDYKTGRQHEDHYHQMAAYAYLVWDKAGRPPAPKFRVEATVVYLEDLSIHPYSFTVTDILKWEAEVGIQANQPRYTVGRKCANCSLSGTCPAYETFNVGNTLKIFNEKTAIPQSSWELMTPEQRGQLIDRIYMVERAIDRAKLGLRNLVKQKGRVDIGKGFEQTLVAETTTFLDARKSMPILVKRIGQVGVGRIVRVPLDDALTAYSNRAGKGLKTQAREDLFEELDKAGAIVRIHSSKMWRRPIGEQTLED